MARSFITHALEAGRLLAEAKAAVEHGQWLPWLDANFKGSARTAQRYVTLWEGREQLESNTTRVSHLSVREGLRLLSEGEPRDTKPREARPACPVPQSVRQHNEKMAMKLHLMALFGGILEFADTKGIPETGDLRWMFSSQGFITRCEVGEMVLSFNEQAQRVEPALRFYSGAAYNDQWGPTHWDFANAMVSFDAVERGAIELRRDCGRPKQWLSRFDPAELGLKSEHLRLLNDDRLGRTLDRLFKVDLRTLMTRLVVHMVREFGLELERMHNDSTSVTLTGAYRQQPPRKDGRRRLKIVHGHNKDHRPDLKQLVWTLTISADGAVPVHYNVDNGNVTDDQTHVQTWEVLRHIVGRAEFIYVADSKLCTKHNMGVLSVQQEPQRFHR